MTQRWSVVYLWLFLLPDTITLLSMKLAIATRIHLGKASSPPADLEEKLVNFTQLCHECHASHGVIAVDASHADLCQTVRSLVDDADTITVLPVTPWGKFVPALNALVAHGCALGSDYILFVSAETTVSAQSLQKLVQDYMDDTTLVVGARLSGHEYQLGWNDLNGQTSPWNTLAIWNLRKLALTGFQLCSEGLLTDDENEPSFGIEEVVAACLLQKLLGLENAKVKLVQLEGVTWNQQFDDPEREAWHQQKMESKRIRAERQLKLTGLSGQVLHC